MPSPFVKGYLQCCDNRSRNPTIFRNVSTVALCASDRATHTTLVLCYCHLHYFVILSKCLQGSNR